MKKLYKATAATLLLSAFLGTSLNAQTLEDIAKLDVKNECDVKKNSLKTVLATATKYNAMAKKQGVEFKRLGMSNTQYVDATTKAIASGAKTIDIVNKKKKKTGTVTSSYAAWRSCSFAIRALQQKHEAKSTWKLAVPGDGFKY
jgi:hypothetical protein